MIFSKHHIFHYEGSSSDQAIRNIETPNKCPLCFAHIEPEYLSLAVVEENLCTIQYFCKSCNKIFLTDYRFINYTNSYGTYIRECLEGDFNSYPINFSKREFDEKIHNMSSDFSVIFNQGVHAEALGLDQIAGMAYRKSLEFLIKDFAIHKNPTDKDKISNPKYFLGNCIEDYIDAINLKNVTKIAVWLGNDETHYTRIHTDKDINDLKLYIETAVHFILYELFAESADQIVNQ